MSLSFYGYGHNNLLEINIITVFFYKFKLRYNYLKPYIGANKNTILWKLSKKKNIFVNKKQIAKIKRLCVGKGFGVTSLRGRAYRGIDAGRYQTRALFIRIVHIHSDKRDNNAIGLLYPYLWKILRWKIDYGFFYPN